MAFSLNYNNKHQLQKCSTKSHLILKLVTERSHPHTPATSTRPNLQHTGSHLTSGLVGHFPSVDLTSNTVAQISAKPQTVTLHCPTKKLHPHRKLPPHQDERQGMHKTTWSLSKTTQDIVQFKFKKLDSFEGFSEQNFTWWTHIFFNLCHSNCMIFFSCLATAWSPALKNTKHGKFPYIFCNIVPKGKFKQFLHFYISLFSTVLCLF